VLQQKVGDGPHFFRRLLRLIQIDRAVAFALFARAWQGVAGPVTLVLVAQHMSAEMQGYYYTFASVVALQSFIELGFSVIVLGVASHEWAKLRLEDGRILGTPEARSRLISLGRLVFKWYAAASALFLLVVGTAGYFFFALKQTTVAWEAPWCALVVLSALLFWAMPFNTLLEGCNQVATLNYFRLTQAIASSLGLWLALAMGAGLWAAVVAAAISLLRDLYLLLVRYRGFFEPFTRRPESARIDWQKEIWPRQWRLAASGLFAYFAFSLFVPVLFHYHGPVVAGQMGMTWALVTALQGIAMAWLQPKVPVFGMLIAQREYAALDRLFFRTSAITLLIMSVAAAALWAVVLWLSLTEHELRQRILAPLPTGLFFVAAVIVQVSVCLSAYLRAHNQEPLMPFSIFFGASVGLLVWLLGSRFAATGAAAGYLIAVTVAVAWQFRIWARCRAAWHV
jgi:O-antigen/teichoic acid export membrane protein